MDFIPDLISFFLHLDRHLAELANQYGSWIYAILFLIIFCETGLVVTPFLPGDSLLFAAGALAAREAPRTAPAPGRFSMTNAWSSSLRRSSQIRRAKKSVAPPAANGTTTLTGRVGYAACAKAPGIAFSAPSAAIPMNTRR